MSRCLNAERTTYQAFALNDSFGWWLFHRSCDWNICCHLILSKGVSCSCSFHWSIGCGSVSRGSSHRRSLGDRSGGWGRFYRGGGRSTRNFLSQELSRDKSVGIGRCFNFGPIALCASGRHHVTALEPAKDAVILS